MPALLKCGVQDQHWTIVPAPKDTLDVGTKLSPSTDTTSHMAILLVSLHPHRSPSIWVRGCFSTAVSPVELPDEDPEFQRATKPAAIQHDIEVGDSDTDDEPPCDNAAHRATCRQQKRPAHPEDDEDGGIEEPEPEPEWERHPLSKGLRQKRNKTAVAKAAGRMEQVARARLKQDHEHRSSVECIHD